MNAILDDPATQTYEDTELLIFDTCHAFIRKYGPYDADDMMGPMCDSRMFADACLLFTKAYQAYNPERRGRDTGLPANFATYLRFKIWYGLLSHKRRITIKCKAHTTEPINGTDLAAPENPLARMHELLLSVSKDAAQVISIVLDPPQEIAHRLKGTDNTQRIRKAVVDFLVDTLGWDCDRVDNVWEEIQTSLT